ncbi:MAG: hypothetical protein ABFR75_04200 [Acidobacteriota bacterium]
MRIKTFLSIFALIVLIFSFNLESFTFSNYLPRIEKGKEAVTIKVSTLSRSKDFYIYYKTDGIDKYQVRKMKIDKDGYIYYRLPIENLYGARVDYFIVDSGKDKKKIMSPVFTVTKFTTKESPEVYFMSDNSGSTAVKKKNPFLKLSASLSTSTKLMDNNDYPGKDFTASSNMRLYKNIYDNEYQFDFDSNFTYMDKNSISENESQINLTSMMVRFKKGNHKFEVGDVSINNTEFTTSYLSRRGLNYEMNGQKIYVNAFTTNSQQKKGFDGFGIPAPRANLFGTTIGYNYKSMFKVRALFLTGKDTVDSKTVVSTDDLYREGNLISTWSELHLFKNKLSLKGEYSRSNFGKGEDSDDVTKESDSAWKAGFNYNYKILNASANYKKIGSKYNSIANLFLSNDKEGLTSNIGLTFKSASLYVTYLDQKDYIDNPLQDMLHTKNMNTTFSWLIGNHFKVGANFGVNNLKYDKSTGLQNSGTDMNTTKYSGSLGFMSGSNGITLKVGKTESENFTSNIDASVALNLKLGKFLTFYPTVSYTNTENFSDNSESNMMSVYISSELSFIPQVFTLSMSGSYSNSESAHSNSKSTSLNANLNFYMTKLFKYKITPTLSIKGKYQESDYNGTKTDSTAVYLQFDLSF